MSPLDDSAAAVARLTGALERQAEELRSVRTLLGLGHREDCRLLRADEVAARLVKSRAWVYRNQHTLGGFRVGGQVRFEAAAIEAYLERCREQSPGLRPPRDGSPARLLPLVGRREGRGGELRLPAPSRCMPRPATGRLEQRATSQGVSYVARFSAFGRRWKIKLGDSSGGMTAASAEHAMQAILADAA